jgi:hypothetical protein
LTGPGALYTTLDRLEEKGLLSSRFGDPTPQRGRRAKRYFTLNAKGLAAIARAQQAYRKLLDGCELPGELPMPDTHSVESILALVTTRVPAAAIAGDLAERGETRSTIRCWSAVLRIAASHVWRSIGKHRFA